MADEAGAAHAPLHDQAGRDTDCTGVKKPRITGPWLTGSKRPEAVHREERKQSLIVVDRHTSNNLLDRLPAQLLTMLFHFPWSFAACSIRSLSRSNAVGMRPESSNLTSFRAFSTCPSIARSMALDFTNVR